MLFLFAYIAGLSHILLDFTNNYGVRPFWPFWGKWYSWDIVFIVEPILYVFLIAGLVAPLIFSRHEPLPRGRTAAVLALICVAGLYAVRDHEHRQAIARARSAELRIGAAGAGFGLSVSGDLLTRWYAVIETQNSFVSFRRELAERATQSGRVADNPPSRRKLPRLSPRSNLTSDAFISRGRSIRW